MPRATAADSGRRAESLVREHLEAAGLRLRERNFRCRWGEVDLIMEEDGLLVFVEVRYRRHRGWGGALASVDPRKQARLGKTARHYLALHPALACAAVRFDVVAVDAGAAGHARLDWVRDAFQPTAG